MKKVIVKNYFGFFFNLFSSNPLTLKTSKFRWFKIIRYVV